MNTTKYFAVVLFALAITIGFSSDSLLAQQSHFGNGHPGACAGGCNHGGGDSRDLIHYGQSGQSAIRQSNQQRRMPPSYGHGDTMGGGMNYAQVYQSNPSYRSAYQGGFNSSNDRENYQIRQVDFTYANDPASGSSPRGQGGCPGGCSGGCSHGHRGGGYNSQAYEGDRQPAFDGGGQYRGGQYDSGQYGNEADRVPQLNMYASSRDNQPGAYGRSSSSQSLSPQSLSPQSFQMRQDYASQQLQGGIGTTSDERYSASGPPATSLGLPSGPGNSGCSHAGCNHN